MLAVSGAAVFAVWLVAAEAPLPALDDGDMLALLLAAVSGLAGAAIAVAIMSRMVALKPPARDLLIAAVEAIPEAAVLVFDADDRVIVRNSRYNSSAAAADVAVPGVRVEEMLRTSVARGIYADVRRGDEEKWISTRLDQFHAEQASFVQPLTDGTWLQVNVRKLPSGGGIVVRTDITELMRRETRLREGEATHATARAQLQDALAELSEGFALYDAEDRLVMCNDRVRQIFSKVGDRIVPGVGFEEIIRLSVERGESDTGRYGAEEFIAKCVERHRNPGSPVEGRFCDGRRILFSERRTREGGIVVVVSDITALKSAEANMRIAKEEAEVANQAKTRFLAAASHDLRQPLHALGMFVAALDERLRGAETRRLIGNIRSTLDALGSLLNALLDISKLDADAIEPEFGSVALRPLLLRLAAEYRPQAAERGIMLRVIARDLFGNSDAALLESMLRNLVSNAIRYTTKGGVLLACRRRNGAIAIEVWDTGVGIPPNKLKSIFQEFNRLDNLPAGSAPGAGLGLAIVDRLARLLGHRLSTRSKLGSGSLFRICLAEAAESSLPAKPQLASSGGYTLSRRAILIVDDDRVVLESMRVLLEGWGCRVQIAASTAEAVICLPSFGAPDAIVADYRLKDETGCEAIAAVRAEIGRPIPAILVTGETGIDDLFGGPSEDYAVLQKPVAPAKLRALLGFHLREAV
ncbi:MAG TPA: PAS-domain containing protein [Candidatus Cybelea sp.]|nr:PAS-domain containing protein [Candidatus Cybelea sp.]